VRDEVLAGRYKHEASIKQTINPEDGCAVFLRSG
jgi:hypothetical protein